MGQNSLDRTRRGLLQATGAGLLVAAGSVPGLTAAESRIEGTYQIESAATDDALAVAENASSEGARVEPVDPDDAHGWEIEPVGDGYRLRATHSDHVLAAEETDDGWITLVQQADRDEATQRWRLEADGDGYQMVNHGHDYLADVRFSGTQFGDAVRLWLPVDDAEQRWSLVDDDPPGDGDGEPDDGTEPSYTERVERGIHDRINEVRRDEGLEELTFDEGLATVAREHSEHQAERGVVFHRGPEGIGPRERVEDADIGCEYNGENLLANDAGEEPPADAAAWCVDQWMNSSGHRNNILQEPHGAQGIGVVVVDDRRLYATQKFASHC